MSDNQNAQRPQVANLLIWLLGGWFFASVFMIFVAIGNFKVLKPENLRNADEVYQQIAPGEPRKLALKYAASEMNRYFFRAFNNAQLVVAIAVLALFWASRRKSKVVLSLLFTTLAISVAMALYFTPTIEVLGRQIDFMPRDPKPPEVERFFLLHTIDVVLELLKVVLIAAASVVFTTTDKP